ncbi:reverse transcriptase (RNA-dependent DNA polymerase) domain-containing protein [Hirsutella rhossiliensis]|uniref:Reverse transcriptase (RNA-dependent DNA polymerase) domain-containing protein n=1 Tax=Hirsutella rhossiliensis TaxID=111463 RepID=A0A9P8MS52_9HYPO|nr:reverse transcriptase (RNA-dependent DNA polymerase) domain-containing protein [Hirsutella rhossiliensis]KAH0961228.1 reverse transcriptase (RNA-dependent DNA polymerase) domain-containing protein [Hirsutella rhossiliensis]
MPDGFHRTLRLKKVAYCPGFSSSLVSLQTLIDDDQIFWDTLSEPMRLVRKGQTIGITERKYQQFVVEYQPVETEFPDFNKILDLPLKETGRKPSNASTVLRGRSEDWTDLARDHENYTYKAKEHGAVLKDFSSFMLARFGFKTNVKVIATRDVVFDEYTFFEGGGERMPLPASIGEMIQQIEIPEDQTANQAILDEETDEDTDIEDLEDDDIRMAEDNEVEEQGQQQSEEQEKKTTESAELEDAYLTPPASDPEEEPHGVFSVHFPYADPNGVVVKPLSKSIWSRCKLRRESVFRMILKRRLTLRVGCSLGGAAFQADLEGLMKESRLKALEPFDQPELDQSYIDRFADFVPVPIEDGVHGAFTAGRLFRPKSAKVHKRDLPEPPQTQKQLEKHPYREEFTQAQRDHLASHAEMGSFDEVFWTKAAGKQVLGCKWCKARLVVCGNQQEKGDLPTRATTLAGMSFRTLMAIAAKHDLELEQMDAVNAFVHAPLDDEEVIFMRMPPGFQKRGKVLRLRKALYGLRRSPLLWQQMLTSSLEELGFRKVPQEPCVMMKGAVTVFFYVDDIIWAFRKEDEGVVEEATRGLQKKINLTRLGEPRWFLGIHAYIDKIAYKFLLNNDNAPESLKLPDTPMISDEELLPATSQANEREKHQYLQKVGSVLFSAISTRPDIAFAVSRLARHNHNPDEKHQKAADRVILFLFATRSQFSRQEELTRLRHDPIWRISGVESVKASDSHDVKHGG